MRKEQLTKILDDRDWKSLKENLVKDKGIIRDLMSRIYVKEGLRFWHTVEALGVATYELEKIESGYSVELVRRYFWSLNEESGGTAWNASEAIGSIIYHNTKECGHFNWMFSGLLEDENLQQGVLWGLAHIVMNSPEVVHPLAERVLPFLEKEDVNLRGLAVWIYQFLQEYDNKGIWSIPEDLLQKLSHDESIFEFYFNGVLKPYRISEIFKMEAIAYWSEVIHAKDFDYNITVANSGKGLCWVGLGSQAAEQEELKAWLKRRKPETVIIRREGPNQKVMAELREYFAGTRQEFSVPLDSVGTPFQLQVWEELRNIPYGGTRTYSDIARLIGNSKGQRAVGLANNKNPIAIIVPCHRVIGKNGSLVGYAGGLDLKDRLLKHEAKWK